MSVLKMRMPTRKEFLDLAGVTEGNDAKMHWKHIYTVLDDDDTCFPDDIGWIGGFGGPVLLTSGTKSEPLEVVGFRPVFDIAPGSPLHGRMVTGQSCVIGTLYMGNKPVKLGKNPVNSFRKGDIPEYIPGASLEIREAIDDPDYQVRVYCIGDVLIADRCLLEKVCKNDLKKILGCEDATDLFPSV